MTRLVTIKHGIGRQAAIVENVTVPLLREPEIKQDGRICLRVDASKTAIAHPNTKIYVKSDDDFTIYNGDYSENTVIPMFKKETDEEIGERILETFSVLRAVSKGVADGILRGLVIAGAPGVGKSYEVIKTVEEYGLTDKSELLETITEDSENDSEEDEEIQEISLSGVKTFEVVKGHITASSLFELLYRNRDENNTIIMDDIDSIFGDDKALNLLKAALDTSSKRRITWGTAYARRDGVPSVFDFKGSIIFISNKDFNQMKGSSSVGKHIEAIMSRCLFLDMGITNTREKVIRIKQVAMNEGLFAENGIVNEQEQKEIMDFMYEYADNFRELSLRSIVHLATIYKMDNWKAIARQTLLNK